MLITLLEGNELILFCPEDDAFGTPRPTMDLIKREGEYCAVSNADGEDLSLPIVQYAQNFFDANPDIELFIGKDRSPSCGVCSARGYDEEKNLISANEVGLMAKEAKKRNIYAVDAEDFKGWE